MQSLISRAENAFFYAKHVKE